MILILVGSLKRTTILALNEFVISKAKVLFNLVIKVNYYRTKKARFIPCINTFYTTNSMES